MRRILSSFMTLAFLAAVGAGPALAMDKMTGSTMHNSSMMKSTKCAKGSTWVHGYTNKMTGKKVAGYCRHKTKMAGSTTKM